MKYAIIVFMFLAIFASSCGSPDWPLGNMIYWNNKEYKVTNQTVKLQDVGEQPIGTVDYYGKNGKEFKIVFSKWSRNRQ